MVNSVTAQVQQKSESSPHRIYGIFANIWGILMVNVTINGIHTDPMRSEVSRAPASAPTTPTDPHGRRASGRHAEHPPQAAAAAGGRPLHWEPQSADATGGRGNGGDGGGRMFEVKWRSVSDM